MKKTELYEAVAAKLNDKKAAKAAVDATLAAINEALVKGDEVRVTGFGTFAVKARAARTCTNPRTGEKMEVPAAKVVTFKAGKVLKDSIAK